MTSNYVRSRLLMRGDGRALLLLRGGLVIKYSIAVVARADLIAATDLCHHLRPERHEACGARAVARLGHRHAVAYARADALVDILHGGRQRRKHSLTLAPARLQLFSPRPRLRLRALPALVALSPQLC